MRIGPANKLYCLLFTHRIWQHRSDGKKHEADYNLDLLKPLGLYPQRMPTRLVLTQEERLQARKTLEGMRISFRKPIVIMHPGSGGSSSRWPLTHFMELGDRLQEHGYEVVVTGGPGEDYQYVMIDNMRRIPVFIAAGSVSIRELAAIMSWSNLVITNSTGPLHMAVALDIPTVSIFSPVPTCHPQRWGPYPAYPEGNRKHRVIIAQDQGLEKANMELVSVDELFAACQQQLAVRNAEESVGRA